MMWGISGMVTLTSSKKHSRPFLFVCVSRNDGLRPTPNGPPFLSVWSAFEAASAGRTVGRRIRTQRCTSRLDPKRSALSSPSRHGPCMRPSAAAAELAARAPPARSPARRAGSNARQPARPPPPAAPAATLTSPRAHPARHPPPSWPARPRLTPPSSPGGGARAGADGARPSPRRRPPPPR